MKKEEGFSIIEVIIAAAIFAVGVLAIAGMQYTSFFSVGAGDRRVCATNLVEQSLEAARNQGISQFNSGSYTGDYDSLGNAVPADYSTGVKFTRVVTVSGNIVTSTVSWNVKGEVKNVTSSTFLY